MDDDDEYMNAAAAHAVSYDRLSSDEMASRYVYKVMVITSCTARTLHKYS